MDPKLIFDVFVGSVPALTIIFTFLYRIDHRTTIWMIEHEVLIADWQKRNPDQVLPTRTKR